MTQGCTEPHADVLHALALPAKNFELWFHHCLPPEGYYPHFSASRQELFSLTHFWQSWAGELRCPSAAGFARSGLVTSVMPSACRDSGSLTFYRRGTLSMTMTLCEADFCPRTEKTAQQPTWLIKRLAIE